MNRLAIEIKKLPRNQHRKGDRKWVNIQLHGKQNKLVQKTDNRNSRRGNRDKAIYFFKCTIFHYERKIKMYQTGYILKREPDLVM